MSFGLWKPFRERRASGWAGQGALRVRIDGRAYRTADYSMGGLRIRDFDVETAPYQRVSGSLSVPGLGKGSFVAEVVWRRERQVGLRFLEVSPSLFLALSSLPTTDWTDSRVSRG